MGGKVCRAVEKVFSTVCGFIDRMIGYTNFQKKSTVNAMYSPLLSLAVSDNFRKRLTGEELEAFGADEGMFKIRS